MAWEFKSLRPHHHTSGSDSVVECDLAKVEVAGSNPVFRSIYGKPQKKLFEMFRGAPKEPRVVWGDMRV